MNENDDSPNPLQRGVRRLMDTRPAVWVMSRTIHHVDSAIMRVSGGRYTAGSLLSGLPIISLTTTGARSGQPRSVPLVGIPDGDRLILIASNWGQARHPAWYHNVKAHPAVTVTRGGRTRGYVARELTGPAREAAWGRAVALYPGYRGYAQRAGREIPVIVLEPQRSSRP